MTMLLGIALTAPVVAAETRTAAPGATAPAAPLADLGWMVGSWEGEGLGGSVHEVYSPPADGQMPGHFRALKDGKAEVVRFPLVAVEKDVWHLNGLTIRRTGADSATPVVRIGEKDGGSREVAFSYRRIS